MSAQAKFEEGYIITLDKDTSYGLLEYQIARKSALQCIFKEDDQSATVTYVPTEIVAYRFTPGKYYVAEEVIIEDKTRTVF